MRRKLLAMDIDGTAVRDDSSLGEKSKEAIKLAQQEGHKIAFVISLLHTCGGIKSL